jgi:4-amino-4-deoxy-L-arabinose transferase-like glycosyltransferase
MAQRILVADATLDSAELSPSGKYRALKQFGLVVLCGAWVLLGLVGHDPWKTEDATAFGIVYEMIQGGDLITPNLTGEPFIDRPPLVYGLAAATAATFEGMLAPHDAARLAAGLLLGLTLLVLSATARELCGRAYRWVPVLLFVGSVGLWDRAHQLAPELGLMLGVALGQYGFALGLRRSIAGGAALGFGAAVAFLSRGFMGPLWLALTALVLPLRSANFRTRTFALALVTAAVVALPLAASWPVALAIRSPADLATWWAAQSWTDWVGPFATRGSADPGVLLKNLLWFASPALLLAAWTLWTRGRGFNGGLNTPAVELPATLALIMGAAIAVMADPKVIYLMPLLVPLVVLGSLEIDTLKREFSGALDWFGILTFGLTAVLVWTAWVWSYFWGMPASVAQLFRDTEAGYHPPLTVLAIGVSVFLTLLWLALVRPARRSNRRAVLNWAAGMTLIWALYSTIWLPYLDSRRSYRAVAQALAVHLPKEGCVASRNLGEPQRALFQYFAGLVTVREEASPYNACGMLLVQYARMDGAMTIPEGWTTVWSGNRRGDDTERFVLYRRDTR